MHRRRSVHRHGGLKFINIQEFVEIIFFFFFHYFRVINYYCCSRIYLYKSTDYSIAGKMHFRKWLALPTV